MARSMKSYLPAACFRRGFTLVELLVAMGVMSLVVVMLTNLINGVTLTTDRSHRRIDADAGARVALDRLGLDLEKMLQRPDVDYAFHKYDGNDTISFYATTQGYGTASRPLSAIAYLINGNYQLDRGARTIAGADWQTPVFVSASTQSLNRTDIVNHDTSISEAKTTLAAIDYQTLCEDILRLEFAYLVKDAAGVRIAKDAPSKFENLRGLVVGVAALDARSRAMTTPAQLAQIAAGLIDAQDGKDILSLWDPVAGKPLAGVPEAATSNVRIYQRYYFLQ